MALTKEDIMNDIQPDKVALSFGLYVISKQSDENIQMYLDDFREMFFDMLKNKSLDSKNLELFILDEADEMLSKGFQDQIYEIFHRPHDVDTNFTKKNQIFLFPFYIF